MLVVPVYVAMIGAVLQFDSNDRGVNFPDLVHHRDFEVYLLVEYIGALVAGGFLVRAVYTSSIHYQSTLLDKLSETSSAINGPGLILNVEFVFSC